VKINAYELKASTRENIYKGSKIKNLP